MLVCGFSVLVDSGESFLKAIDCGAYAICSNACILKCLAKNNEIADGNSSLCTDIGELAAEVQRCLDRVECPGQWSESGICSGECALDGKSSRSDSGEGRIHAGNVQSEAGCNVGHDFGKGVNFKTGIRTDGQPVERRSSRVGESSRRPAN